MSHKNKPKAHARIDEAQVVRALVPFLLVPLAYLIALNVPNQTARYETLYALGINKWVNQLLSLITGTLKFSLAELILYAHVVAAPVVAIILLGKLFKGGFFKSALRVLQYASILYVAFMVLWGFNYGRMSIADMMGFETRPYSKEELISLNMHLIEQANQLRQLQEEDAENVMTHRGDYKDVFNRARLGYEKLGTTVKALSGPYGKPKPVFASNLMLYTGITGVYFPYTAEANVNIAIPAMMLPATTLHEMAHQRGIAPEDEANFIAYATAMAHPDKDFKYSGTVLALIHSMNALYRQDPEQAMALRATYGEGLNRDMVSYSQFWKAYEGKTNEVAEKVNDTYLKSNRQEDGVRSYGRMVDLLLGYYLSNAIIGTL